MLFSFADIRQKIKGMAHSFLYDSMILNWSPLKKSILVLLLGGSDQMVWLLWCLHAYLNPQVEQWFNMEYLYLHMCILSTTLVLFFVFARFAYIYRDVSAIQKYFPYFAVSYFALVFLHGGYSIGIMSPATIAGYVSLATVGLILFERKIIYTTLIPITIILLTAIFLSSHGVIDYAPTFSQSLNQSVLIDNKFWVYSMVYHYIPIFFSAIVLFEILLIQWRHREKMFDVMSKTDALTGMFNRRSINDYLNKLEQKNRGYGVILLDLDYFKSINDHYGHDIGDKVLQRVAKVLNEQSRGGDMVGRFGGEEFMIIVEANQLSDVAEVAERCRKIIEDQSIEINTYPQPLKITASFGVTVALPNMSKEDSVRQADEALYSAKQAGRNCVKTYQPKKIV